MGKELTDDELNDAIARAEAARRVEVRAASARYDVEDGRIVVELTNGCTFRFPTRIAQGLEAASPEQLAAIEVVGAGYGLHWTILDVHLSVSGMMAGSFGTAAHMGHSAVRTASLED